METNRWREEEIFEEVLDKHQQKLSTTWVGTQKTKDGQTITKARLVVRGYEEEENERADSPTCSKENIRLMLAIAVSNTWTVKSLDIKAAFLQGKQIERELFVMPPKEVRKEGYIWKLKEVVNGLRDTSRSWYLRVIEVLENLGVKAS